jgi:hypothetical protein
MKLCWQCCWQSWALHLAALLLLLLHWLLV